MVAMDEGRGAGDELYADVRSIAADILRETHGVEADDERVMGAGPGTYEFKQPQLRAFGNEVVRRLNVKRNEDFVRKSDLKPAMTFGEVCDIIWFDCFEQMYKARVARRLAGAVS